MDLWYISFAHDCGFLGATVVEAESHEGALGEATRRSLNPGGEAAIVRVPPDCEEAKTLLNRLAGEAEMRASGHKKASDLPADVADAFDRDAHHVCQECNS